MKKKMKKFRLNVIISYPKDVNIYSYRNPIHDILTNFAWLYNLEYSIDPSTKLFTHLIEADSYYADPDIIYFRSTGESAIELKAFQKLIKDVFTYNPKMGGVEVGYQLQKVLKNYPFPLSYIKPLNYPYLEVFENGRGNIMIPEAELHQLIDLTEEKSTNC
ncbi:hypothetical protein [Flavobacterium sp. SORGH_AS_0622]|jgi:hypothetical protein|uniref:hypothetical protein n=1 Tax=Flavobacterium sp. SORGH_AS_0622 TaxID=3041772 RepID=UPI002785AC91|nr:hypothetical protein [Flavobacterium sp. SORGH_AS_0622]MDQ1164608.1 hypothetical protein [Flavobacterium sp. SORGH_AS_0622]